MPRIESCPICHDGGWLYATNNGYTNYGQVIRCKCKEEEDRKRRDELLLKLCELPVFAKHMTFANFKKRTGNIAAFKVAQDIANETGRYKWLTVCGKVNTGKTHLAIAVCHAWIAKRKPARYAYVPRLLDELRSGVRDGSIDYRFQVYCTIPLLVLDDLGLENSSSWVSERLVTIINERLMNELPLIVTTNKDLDSLPGDDEHRIASRLTRERFSCAVHMKGETQ